MKKYILTLLSIALITTACSKDDDPIQPAPYKVTSVTCLKNGSTDFSMNITYDSDGNIRNITNEKDMVDRYKYQSNKIYIFGPDENIDITYTLSGEKIVKYELENSTGKEVFDYNYEGAYWKNTTTSWTLENGSTEESKIKHEFKWDNGNISTYYAGDNNIRFEYLDDKHPENFPFRILNKTSLAAGEIENIFTQKENFSPINFMFGRNNRQLIKTASWYTTPNPNKLGEYKFEYRTDKYGDIINVAITEILYNSEDGNIKTTNSYSIILEY